MASFELEHRDGLARIGCLETLHGPVFTPALLPVIHPDPARQSIPPKDLPRRFGLGAIITSSYIIWRTPGLRDRAESSGVHGLLGFDGPIMTDSGAFQQHAYGRVEVDADGILGFQNRIGSDIATVLDEFVEPEADHDTAARAVELTIQRARDARARRSALLAVPVQGGAFENLRLESATAASELGDVLAIGGVVPLLEQYRFRELAQHILAARPGLAPDRVVHLFGSGHPITFAFAALMGVDLVDSSAYHKFARRGDLMFPSGTVGLDSIREPICRCTLCHELPLTEVARLPPEDRERRIAEHNLLVSSEEMGRVRQAIRDGSLWELAEQRATGHPALMAGMRRLVRGTRAFLATEPASRRSFRAVSGTSSLRPAVIRFLARTMNWRAGKGEFRTCAWVPLLPHALRNIPTETTDGVAIRWESLTPVGLVPLELTDLYPLGCYLGVEEFEPDSATQRRHSGFPKPDTGDLSVDSERDWSQQWTRRQAESALGWEFGDGAAELLDAPGCSVDRSHRSGRLRWLRDGGEDLVVFGNDGLPRPTWAGARRLHSLVPFPSRRVVVEPDAVEFAEAGRSVFSKFVQVADGELAVGSSALIVDSRDRLLAVGRLMMAPSEMRRHERGVAVRVTAHKRRPIPVDALLASAAGDEG